MGESAKLEGTDRNKVLFSHWVEDAVAVVNELTEGPVVFASCSLGGWLSLVAAQQFPDRLHGMVSYMHVVCNWGSSREIEYNLVNKTCTFIQTFRFFMHQP